MKTQASVIVIHGYTDSPDRLCYHWLRHQLDVRNIHVAIPQMPVPNHPNETEWLDKIDSLISVSESPIILIGHSLGGLAVLRWLEVRASEPIHAVISLAGVTDPTLHPDTTFASEWHTPHHWKRMQENASNIVGIYSQDDTSVAPAEGERLKNTLNATLVMVNGRGHFTDDDGVNDLPELLQSIDALVQLAK